jgi:hypothetical protein
LRSIKLDFAQDQSFLPSGPKSWSAEAQVGSMVQNLVAGSLLVALSVVIHTAGLIFIAACTLWLGQKLQLRHHDAGRTLIMTAMVLGILAVLTIEVWSWALAYSSLGATGSFADSLYLSTAMFATVGPEGITFDPRWRLLSALEGINGFLLIGWSTAFLVRASTRHGPFRREEHF